MLLRFVLVSLAWLLVLVSVPLAPRAHAAPLTQSSNCLFFSEAVDGPEGYSVCDDGQARFRSAFENWGLQKIGYPISQRYERDGFVTQAFQKAIMQWRPDGTYVALVNIFDDLHHDGFDQRLLETRQTPVQLPAGWDGEGLSFQEIVEKRQALLDARPALRAAYFSSSDPLTFFGLPTSEVQDMGNHYAIRLQRAVLQEWKEDVPWASAGQVTIANGGDIAKELGGLPSAALVPESAAPVADAPPSAPSTGMPAGLTQAQVVNVVDGDTADVLLNGATVRLRLIGLDTPETVDPRKPVQCFGREASDRAHQLLDGQTVYLEADPSQGEWDAYDRLLRYLWLPDGRLFNQQMIAEGYAHEYTYNLPYKYQAQFQAAERAAREQGLGLWSPATCNGDTEQAAGGAPAPQLVSPPVGGSGGYSGPYDPHGPDRDCGDFSTHADAQAFFEAAGGPASDPHRLDTDNDGIACESLG